MLLAGWQQALTVFVIIIPGFVYQGVRARLRGPTPEDQDFKVRLLRALATSAIFALGYVTVVGFALIWTGIPKRPEHLEITGLEVFTAGLLTLALVFLFPAAGALVFHVRAVKKLYPNLPRKQWFSIYDPTPTAWDFAVNRVGPSFVRVLLSDGRWVGGYAEEDSFFTSYPEAREIFVEKAWQLDDEGQFGDVVENTAGRWIKCDDALIVEFIKPAAPATGTTARGETKLGWVPLILGLVLLRWCRKRRD
jgi:Family of unknown function (DUF6338)